MFESAELGHAIDDATFDREEEGLRTALLEAQLDAADAARFPVIVVVEGVDGAGKGETINLLHKWLDPRHVRTRALGEPTPEEHERPWLWRYWRALPPKGKVGVFVDAWYHELIVAWAKGDFKKGELDRRLQDVARFEQLLIDEGALLLKFWLHLSKPAQKARFKRLESDPETSWRVTKEDWRRHKRYDRLRSVAERVLAGTGTATPWLIVEGSDANYRHLTVGQTLLRALRGRLDDPSPPVRPVRLPPSVPATDGLRVLDWLDLSQTLEKDEYEDQLAARQGHLNRLSRRSRFRRDVSVVAVFEGQDASGKGGSIRRVTAALDARQYEIIRIGPPTEEERCQPYLWRFWRHLPGRGEFTLFDRSWYGRVLVERVEGLAVEADWLRAYSEINDFEDQLARHGILVVKFWFEISHEEQARRFEARQETPYKRYKITPEDWRNRAKWDQYRTAASDMIDRTSTAAAPWVLIEGNDKRRARIKVLKTLGERIEAALA